VLVRQAQVSQAETILSDVAMGAGEAVVLMAVVLESTLE